MFDDIGEMISLLVRVLGTNSAQLLDPMVRPDLLALCHKHAPEIEKIKAADERLRQAQEQLRQAEEEAAKSVAEKTKKHRGP